MSGAILRSTLAAGALLSFIIGAPTPTMARDYDGEWQGWLDCPTGAARRLAVQVLAKVQRNTITFESRFSPGTRIAVTGPIQPDGSVAVNGWLHAHDHMGMPASSTLQLRGRFVAPERFDGTGRDFGQSATRECSLFLTSLTPAPGSLAAAARDAREREAQARQLTQPPSAPPSPTVPAARVAATASQRSSPPSASPDSELAATRAELERTRRAAAEARAEAERQRLEVERQRTEAERQRAEAERQRAEAARRTAEGAVAAVPTPQPQLAAAPTQALPVPAPQPTPSVQHPAARQQDRIEGVVGEIILPRGETAETWIVRAAAIPIQQQQFCRIIDKFYDDISAVQRVRNDIRRNALFRDRQADLAHLLPGGAFENWLVRIVEVTQAPDGSAAVLLQPPCRVLLGSDACQREDQAIRATVAPTSPIFRELERVGTGDFVAVSGTITYAAREQRGLALPAYAVHLRGQTCATQEGGAATEVFVTELRYLIRLR